MPRPCSVCARLDRAALDVELARPIVNVADFCRRHSLKETSVKRHRAEHVPTLLRIYGMNEELPKLGELHGELLKLYSSALDNLAIAQAGTLYHVDDKGIEHRRVSHTAVARAISETRKTLDAISRLAADAADENERPRGMADGVLTERIQQQLQRVVDRATTQHEHAISAPDDAVLVHAGDAGNEGLPGGLSVGGGVPSPSQISLDAVKALSTAQGISPQAAKVIADDEYTSAPNTSPETPGIAIPNPRYPGSKAATREERQAAGYPDLLITMEDLRSRPDLLAQLAIEQTQPAPPSD